MALERIAQGRHGDGHRRPRARQDRQGPARPAETDRVVVERINLVKRHTKPRGERSRAASSRRRRRCTSRTCSRSARAATSPRAIGPAARSRTAARVRVCRRCGEQLDNELIDGDARLRERYQHRGRPGAHAGPRLHEPPRRCPRLEKIVLNMGLGEAVQNPKIIDVGRRGDRRPSPARSRSSPKSKKAISNFKLREKHADRRRWSRCAASACTSSSTARVGVALPRVRDFRACPTGPFDGRGNYSLGLREQVIFPEINLDKVDKIKGLTVDDLHDAPARDAEGKALLRALGMPFRGVSDGQIHGEDVSHDEGLAAAEVPGSAHYNRCPLCGRPRAFYRRFRMCRLCLREPRAQGTDSRPREGELVATMLTDPDRRHAHPHPQRRPARARPTVDVPWSRHKEAIARVLVDEGYLARRRRASTRTASRRMLRIALRYDERRRPVITGIERRQPAEPARLRRRRRDPGDPHAVSA